MRLRWTRPALSSLREIAAYIAEDNPAAARRTISRIRKEAEKLPSHPEIGRSGRVEGTRELILSDLPYIVAYRTGASRIEILEVIHAARRWPESF